MPLSGVYNSKDGEAPQKKRQIEFHDTLPTHGMVMDDNVWSRLPSELIEWVLTNLPVDAMLRFRSVCKAWKAFISSYGFVELCYNSDQKGPWCLALSPNCQGCAVYDVGLDKWWYPLPLPSVAARHQMQPFDSVGGFICFKRFDNSSFFIYNPLTRSCSNMTPKRPRMSSERDKAWVVVDQSEGFIVIVVAESTHYEVYDSYSNKWSKVGTLPFDINISQDCCFPARSVSIDGILYLVSNFPHDLVTYDTITGSWSKLYVPWPSQSFNHILTEYRGRIRMLAFWIEDNKLSFCEWELQTTRMVWAKVEALPEFICPELFADPNSGWEVQCLANRELVLLRFRKADGWECLIQCHGDHTMWKSICSLPLLTETDKIDYDIKEVPK